jgi:hypothetical protein
MHSHPSNFFASVLAIAAIGCSILLPAIHGMGIDGCAQSCGVHDHPAIYESAVEGSDECCPCTHHHGCDAEDAVGAEPEQDTEHQTPTHEHGECEICKLLLSGQHRQAVVSTPAGLAPLSLLCDLGASPARNGPHDLQRHCVHARGPPHRAA